MKQTDFRSRIAAAFVLTSALLTGTGCSQSPGVLRVGAPGNGFDADSAACPATTYSIPRHPQCDLFVSERATRFNVSVLCPRGNQGQTQIHEPATIIEELSATLQQGNVPFTRVDRQRDGKGMFQMSQFDTEPGRATNTWLRQGMITAPR